MQIRRIVLKTVDGLSPLPMSSAWVRDGLFVIGMDSEFAVYSQWRNDNVSHEDTDIMDHRNLADSDLMTIAQVYLPHFWQIRISEIIILFDIFHPGIFITIN